MAEIDWSLVSTEATKYVVGAVFGIFLSGIVWLRNRARRLYFTAESWILFSNKSRSAGKEIERFHLEGTVKSFSRKSDVIALHKSAIEVDIGSWRRRKVLHRFEEVQFGNGYANGSGTFTFVTYDKLKELRFPPDEWVVIDKLSTGTFPLEGLERIQWSGLSPTPLRARGCAAASHR